MSLVLRGGIGAVPGTASRSASLRSLWSSTWVARLLWHALPRLVSLTWRSAHTVAGPAAPGPHPLAHRCGDCWWCHDEVHCAQHHRSWGVEFRRPRQAAVPLGVLSCRRALSPVVRILCSARDQHVRMRPPVPGSFLFLHLFAVDSLDVLNPRKKKVCSQIVLKCKYLARIGRPDILWSVNKTCTIDYEMDQSLCKRLNRLISNIHHTCEYRHVVMWVILQDNADWDCFKTPILRWRS